MGLSPSCPPDCRCRGGRARTVIPDAFMTPKQSSNAIAPTEPRSRHLITSNEQTLFTPDSRLTIPSEILGPFHAPSLSSDSPNHPSSRDYPASSDPLSPHPDPAVFSEFENGVCSMLQESLYRFASSKITNVGMVRTTSNSFDLHLFSPRLRLLQNSTASARSPPPEP